MVVGVIITVIVGVLLIVLGYLVWKKEKISLLHDYHYNNVSEEDKRAFCTLSGIGLLIMGAGILIAAVLLGVTGSVLSFIAVGVGLAVGMALLIRAARYNKK